MAGKDGSGGANKHAFEEGKANVGEKRTAVVFFCAEIEKIG